MDGLPSVGIIGTGSYFADAVPVGIPRQRGGADRRSAPALAAAAARRAVDVAGLAPERLSYVVATSGIPGGPWRAVASGVRHLIGAHQATAFDVNAAFDTNAAYGGFVQALTMAEGVLRGEPVGAYALVVGMGAGAEAGAVVLGPVPRGRGMISTSLLVEGDVTLAVSDVLKRAGVARPEVRHVLVQEPAVSVPVALDRLSKQRLLDDGDVVVVCDRGSGGSVGCGLLRWAGMSAAYAWAPAVSCSLQV
jgi:3-oxoacyl-[acyl-carrier-protein] synthase III